MFPHLDDALVQLICLVFAVVASVRHARLFIGDLVPNHFDGILSVNCHDQRIHRQPPITLMGVVSVNYQCELVGKVSRRKESPSTGHGELSVKSLLNHRN